jgi:hypothetical protein
MIEENQIGANLNANSVPGSNVMSPTTGASGMRVETLEGGMVRYFRSGQGKLTAHANNSPSDGWRKFDQTLVDGEMYGMGWRSEMMDLSKLTGAGVRGFADNINRVIISAHETLADYALIDLRFKLACLIDRGDIPAHPEWDQWVFPKPARFDVDRRHTSAYELDEVRAGRISMADAIERDGGDYEQILESQAKYLDAQRRVAAKYNLTPLELGSLARPGDVQPDSQQKPSAAEKEEETE